MPFSKQDYINIIIAAGSLIVGIGSLYVGVATYNNTDAIQKLDTLRQKQDTTNININKEVDSLTVAIRLLHTEVAAQNTSNSEVLNLLKESSKQTQNLKQQLAASHTMEDIALKNQMQQRWNEIHYLSVLVHRHRYKDMDLVSPQELYFATSEPLRKIFLDQLKVIVDDILGNQIFLESDSLFITFKEFSHGLNETRAAFIRLEEQLRFIQVNPGINAPMGSYEHRASQYFDNTFKNYKSFVNKLYSYSVKKEDEIHPHN